MMLVRHQHAEADALLARTSASAKTKRFTGRMQEVAELQVQRQLSRGEFGAAAALADEQQLPIAQARALWAQGLTVDALQLVTRHQRDSDAKGLAQEALKAQLLQALLLEATGEPGSALQVLRQAVARAEPQGSIRLFVDEGAPLQTLLAQLQSEPGGVPYVAQLLQAFDAPAPGAGRVAVAAAATQSTLPAEVFSQREVEILRLIQQGQSNQAIGEGLFVSLSTVKWHNQNIFAKLGVQRRTEAVARALEVGLL
jgi:LuxR family maltose regulon positive regulatory protein